MLLLPTDLPPQPATSRPALLAIPHHASCHCHHHTVPCSYVRFATAAFGRAAQQRLQDSLLSLLDTRPALTDMLTGALGGNSIGNSSLSLFGAGNSNSTNGGLSGLLVGATWASA